MFISVIEINRCGKNSKDNLKVKENVVSSSLLEVEMPAVDKVEPCFRRSRMQTRLGQGVTSREWGGNCMACSLQSLLIDGEEALILSTPHFRILDLG